MADTCKNCGAPTAPATWEVDGLCPGCRNDAARGDLAARMALVDGTDAGWWRAWRGWRPTSPASTAERDEARSDLAAAETLIDCSGERTPWSRLDALQRYLTEAGVGVAGQLPVDRVRGLVAERDRLRAVVEALPKCWKHRGTVALWTDGHTRFCDACHERNPIIADRAALRRRPTRAGSRRGTRFEAGLVLDLWPHQSRALATLLERWQSVRSIVAVMPTAGGKSRLGAAVVLDAVERGQRTLWLAHRKELIEQAAATLVANGVRDIGIISPHHHADRYAKTQVASIDTLLARKWSPEADLVVYDEAHRAPAKTRRGLVQHYADARRLGLTATPQRSDGQGLNDLFDAMVVAANYSELIAGGFIVPCRVFQPPEYLRTDLAKDPLDALRELQQKGLAGLQWIAFGRDVKDCENRVREFRMGGIRSTLVTGKTSKTDRDRIFADFRSKKFQVLWNVDVCSEGTDIPGVGGVLLAANCGNAMVYLQRVGRGLRSAPGKEFAVLLDLVGVSLPTVYDVPTRDRVYSLDGRPITVEGAPLKSCPKCGSTVPAHLEKCDSFMPDGAPCGHVFEGKPRKAPKIWNLELREAVDALGGDVNAVAPDLKMGEAKRLLSEARARKYDVMWAIQNYQHLFSGERFPMQLVTAQEKREQYAKMAAAGKARGAKPSAAGMKFKAIFGWFPPPEWG